MYQNTVLNTIRTLRDFYTQQHPSDAGLYTSYETLGFSNVVDYWLHTIAGEEVDSIRKMCGGLTFTQYGKLLLIKYNDLGVDWDAYDGFYRDCRSCVINLQKMEFALLPFRKFFNVNEREETSIARIEEQLKNARTVEITEKLDGSMVSARWYEGELLVAGSKALDCTKSYRLDHYYKWFNQHPNAIRMLQDNADSTFIFESIWGEDPHVVQYSEEQQGLHLIGIRNANDGKNASYEAVQAVAQQYDMSCVKSVDLSFEQVVQECQHSDKPSDEAEGFVLNIDGSRYKCKYTNYVMMHRALSKLISHNAVIEAIQKGKIDDFVAMVPAAYRPQVIEITDNVNTYVRKMNAAVSHWASLIPQESYSDRKVSMIWITSNVPREFQSKVRQKYLGQEVDYLKRIKYSEIKKIAQEG